VKRGKLIIGSLFAVLAIALLAYFFLTGERAPRYRWNEGYRADNRQPYGTQFIRQMLEAYRPGEKFIYNEKQSLREVLDSSMRQTDYVFIGQALNVDGDDEQALINFISAGNDALIVSSYLPYSVLDQVWESDCDSELYVETLEVKTATMNFFHDTLRTKKGYSFTYRNGKHELPYFWNSVNEELFCDEMRSLVPLGHLDSMRINFLRIPVGRGNLYLHCNPIVFTNYFISKPGPMEYASGVFSHLKGGTIIWDEFSKTTYFTNNANQVNPLSYILQHDSLKYAWWLMLGSVLLYTVFAARRQQRIIPVLEQKVNTSLEYVKMIATLYFQNGDHWDMGRKKMKYFLYFIRARYGVQAHHLTEDHIRRLSERSGVGEGTIQSIFTFSQSLEKTTDDKRAADQLQRLYNAIDYFYKHCK
jgi:hypothetical protein